MESTIPLQLPGIRHAILIGDERQLPAMVKCKISENAEFGRSLFERMVLLGQKKHLLNVQYRMHPSISLFPNMEFYSKQISDAPNVKERTYQRQFLQGNMYGPYSFINVAYGEDFHAGSSQKNMVEVSVVADVVASLFKESVSTRERVTVGLISPYKAQVFAIQEKLGNTYNTNSNISTSVRYCLWVLGNGSTLINSGSVWEKIVIYAKDRGCYYNADEDKSLAKAIIDALVELGQLNDLFIMDSLLFRGARWKVSFCDDYLKSMARIKSIAIRKEVVDLLMKLSSGWHHPHKKGNLNLMKQYTVGKWYKLVWSVDILIENSNFIQVLKTWDILPLAEIQNY
ncbi:hypothetical protein HHK36_014655 [Tetracentron sinense]|uniref:DNA2/NAM7 helicase-like C-terminal domain-containing protein n=1 Tax=Tetracentron sinense TaxID=13715 RepID=A0A834Z7S5_TETSI|nr:hypothetical protein HHK36_014655 [Tetracentron sinense]